MWAALLPDKTGLNFGVHIFGCVVYHSDCFFFFFQNIYIFFTGERSKINGFQLQWLFVLLHEYSTVTYWYFHSCMCLYLFLTYLFLLFRFTFAFMLHLGVVIYFINLFIYSLLCLLFAI